MGEGFGFTRDFVNGFIESYGDPLGLKASWESIVNFKDLKQPSARKSSALMPNGLKITHL